MSTPGAALVGESGCGKSVLAAAITGLLPANAEVAGRVELDGRNLLEGVRMAQDLVGPSPG